MNAQSGVSGLYYVFESVVLVGSQDTDGCQFDEADELYLLNLLVLLSKGHVSLHDDTLR